MITQRVIRGVAAVLLAGITLVPLVLKTSAQTDISRENQRRIDVHEERLRETGVRITNLEGRMSNMETSQSPQNTSIAVLTAKLDDLTQRTDYIIGALVLIMAKLIYDLLMGRAMMRPPTLGEFMDREGN